jgi:hypothetical protein
MAKTSQNAAGSRWAAQHADCPNVERRWHLARNAKPAAFLRQARATITTFGPRQRRLSVTIGHNGNTLRRAEPALHSHSEHFVTIGAQTGSGFESHWGYHRNPVSTAFFRYRKCRGSHSVALASKDAALGNSPDLAQDVARRDCLAAPGIDGQGGRTTPLSRDRNYVQARRAASRDRAGERSRVPVPPPAAA